MRDETTPAADYDSPWKEALAHYLPDAFALFFPEVHAQIDWRRGDELLDYRIFDRHNHPLMRVAILGDEKAAWRPASFGQELWGCAVALGLLIDAADQERLDQLAEQIGAASSLAELGAKAPDAE